MFMSLFEQLYKNTYNNLNENAFAPNSLDPSVFYFPDNGADPILMPGIKAQIINDIKYINQAEGEFVQTRIWDYILTGPILDKDSSDTCPIIIKTVINTANLDDITKERILQRIKEINDRKAFGTDHPIVYIPTIRKIKIEDLNGAYLPFTQRWLKTPNFLNEKKNSPKDISRIKQKSKHSLIKGLRKVERI